MKPKMKWGLIAAVPVALFLVLGRWLGSALHLSGFGYQLFWIGFTLLGAMIGGALFWFMGRVRGRKQPVPIDPLDEDLGARLGEIQRRLAGAKRPGMNRLPTVLILGPPASGKSSLVIGSEVAAEQLAGDPVRGQRTLPTRSINAWYSDGTMLLEAGSELREQTGLWSKLLRRVRPRKLLAAILTGKAQAPRAAVVCFSCEQLLGDGAGEPVLDWARNLRNGLLGMCQVLGVRVPVYVLFTKADEIPSFADYAGQLKELAGRQVLGATLPPPADFEAASYPDRQHQVLRSTFDDLFRSLALKRLRHLGPDLESAQSGRVYEFPREFRKLSDTASRFLVELCKPSQLQLSPFLRGFYFVGREEVSVEEAARPQPEVVTRIVPADGATQVFDPASLARASGSPPIQESRGAEVRHRWLFLPRVVRDVVLRDDIAEEMMRRGQKVSLGRQILLGTGVVVFLFLSALLASRFGESRRFQRSVDEAIQDLRVTATTEGSRGELLRRLEVVRAKADTLGAQRSQNRLVRMVRWMGLSPASALLPEVNQRYAEWFRPNLLLPALSSVTAELTALPDAPAETSDYQASYNRLRAYLMSTRYPDRGEAEFLGDVLSREGSWARSEENIDLARRQFEFFGRRLRSDSRVQLPAPEEEVVTHAQTFLRAFRGAQPFFQSLKYRVDQQYSSVNLSGPPTGPRPLLIPDDVPGAFSTEGRRFVKELLRTPDSLPLAEEWVLGERAVYDPASMVEELDSLYEAEFADQWLRAVLGSRIAPFRGPEDAVEKLAELAGDDSPLMAFLGGVRGMVGEMYPGYQDRFQALDAFLAEDSASGMPVPSPEAEDYLAALDAVEGSMAELADASPDERIARAAEIRSSGVLSDAEEAAERLKDAITPGREGRLVAEHLADLVDEPIRQAGLLVSAVEPAQLNAWAREFCTNYNALVGSKFPLSSSATAEPTLDDLLEVFKPGESRLWRLVSSLQPYVERQGNRYRSTGGSGLTINPGFLEFLSNAHRFSEAVFDQNRDRPRVSFFLRGQRDQSDPAVEAILLNTDGGTISCTLTDCRTTDQIVWDGSAMVFSLSVRLEGESLPVVITPRAEGPWAPFRFFSGSTGLGDPQEVDHVVRWRIPGRNGDVAVAVTAGRSSWVFDPAILRGLQCVDRVVGGS